MEVKVIDAAPAYAGHELTKVTTMGNVVELLTMAKVPPEIKTRKLDRDHFVWIDTGEIGEYNHADNRSESLDSIRHTLANIRSLINTNVTDPNRVSWVTLTYRENMTDTERLYRDWTNFWKRFTYWAKSQGYKTPEYINVIEPQGRGAWHIHGFILWDCIAPFIPNNEVLAPMWGHGFTKIKHCDNCDNVGAYFSAYLADMPVDEIDKLPEEERKKIMVPGSIEEWKDFKDDDGLTKRKPFVKGARLVLYPSQMKIVRHSRNIKVPVIEKMTYDEAKEKVSAATETFSRTYRVADDEGTHLQTITKSYYNRIRPKKQAVKNTSPTSRS